MVTEHDLLKAISTLCNEMDRLSIKQKDALLTIIQYQKHQAVRREREAQGLGYLNREEDAVEAFKNLDWNPPKDQG